MRNLLTRVPKSAQSFVATMVRTIFAQPDAATVHEQHARIVAQLEQRFPEAAALLEEAGFDLLAFTSFPKEHWRQLWSNNSLERLNKEIRRRTDPPWICLEARLGGRHHCLVVCLDIRSVVLGLAL
jgi:transposase-like protein